MNAAPIEKKSSKRGAWSLVAFILLLIIGVCGAWYYASQKLEETVHNYQQRLLARDRIVDCENLQVRGFPFRLGIFCDRILLENTKTRSIVTSSAIRSAAQLYDPGKFIVEFDGPARLDDAQLGIFKLNWQSLRASGRVNLDGLEYSSIIAHAIAIHKDAGPTPLATSETLELHVRKLNGNDFDLAIGAGNFNLTEVSSQSIQKSPAIQKSPVIQASLEFTATDIFSVIQQRKNLISHLKTSGGGGHLNAFKLVVPNDGILEISGPISIDTNGLLSGVLEIAVTKPQSLVQFFSIFMPDKSIDLSQIETMLQMLSPKNTDTQSHKLKIHIREGNIHLGLFPIGRIPRLF